jgi:hypothetical protein
MQPMQRASRERTALARTTSSTPSAQSVSATSSRGSSISCNGIAASRGNPIGSSIAEPAETEVVVSAAGTFVNEQLSKAGARRSPEARRQLAVAIRQRIELRLGGRVRELAVRIAGDTVVLEGKCYTYYTKQLAQHAALGVLEDEQLENCIMVEVPR